MEPETAIDLIGQGNVKRTAIALNCTPAAIYLWRKKGQMPELYRLRALFWCQHNGIKVPDADMPGTTSAP